MRERHLLGRGEGVGGQRIIACGVCLFLFLRKRNPCVRNTNVH